MKMTNPYTNKLNRSRRHLGFFAASLAVGAGVWLAPIAIVDAQVPTTAFPKSRILPFITLRREGLNAASTTLYTVPPKTLMIVTDVLISNPSATPVQGIVLLSNTQRLTTEISIPANSTFSHSFATGLYFYPGRDVIIETPGSTAINVQLTGYTTQPSFPRSTPSPTP